MASKPSFRGGNKAKHKQILEVMKKVRAKQKERITQLAEATVIILKLNFTAAAPVIILTAYNHPRECSLPIISGNKIINHTLSAILVVGPSSLLKQHH